MGLGCIYIQGPPYRSLLPFLKFDISHKIAIEADNNPFGVEIISRENRKKQLLEFVFFALLDNWRLAPIRTVGSIESY